MLSNETLSDEQIVEENTRYVLGMYDLYPDDEEIIKNLQLKGLSEKLVQRVMVQVKVPAWQKRVVQAKRNIRIGILLFVILFLIPWIIIRLSGFDGLNTDSVGEKEQHMQGMLKFTYNLYKNIYIYVVLASLIQIGFGVFNLVKYKKLLKGSQ